MDMTEALSFLEEHQPMPSDDECKDDEIKKYEEVRKFFLNHRDERCIPLFLNSFGGKDGFGVYQLVEDVIVMYDKEAVLPCLMDAFGNSSVSVKYWCVQISSSFPDGRLFPPLAGLLQADDEDVRMASIAALGQLALKHIRRNEVIKALEEEMKKISEEEIREFVMEILSDIRNENYP